MPKRKLLIIVCVMAAFPLPIVAAGIEGNWLQTNFFTRNDGGQIRVHHHFFSGGELITEILYLSPDRKSYSYDYIDGYWYINGSELLITTFGVEIGYEHRLLDDKLIIESDNFFDSEHRRVAEDYCLSPPAGALNEYGQSCLIEHLANSCVETFHALAVQYGIADESTGLDILDDAIPEINQGMGLLHHYAHCARSTQAYLTYMYVAEFQAISNQLAQLLLSLDYSIADISSAKVNEVLVNSDLINGAEVTRPAADQLQIKLLLKPLDIKQIVETRERYRDDYYRTVGDGDINTTVALMVKSLRQDQLSEDQVIKKMGWPQPPVQMDTPTFSYELEGGEYILSIKNVDANRVEKSCVYTNIPELANSCEH